MRSQIPLWITQLVIAIVSCSAASSGGLIAQPRPEPLPTTLATDPQARIANRQRPIREAPSPAATQSSQPFDMPTVEPQSERQAQDWSTAGPGLQQMPILLYHHVDPTRPAGEFNVVPEQFEEQIQALAEAGFQTITTQRLREAILHGAPMPPRPIVITFDDGHTGNYDYAFPILQEQGYQAVIYVVANRLWSAEFLSASELADLSMAGWEIGSHSMSHLDLTTLSTSELRLEIFGSKRQLESNLGLEITSFAYPFGSFSPEVGEMVKSAGYETGMGLGKSLEQGRGNLYYLSRIVVDGIWTVDQFVEAVGIGGLP